MVGGKPFAATDGHCADGCRAFNLGSVGGRSKKQSLVQRCGKKRARRPGMGFIGGVNKRDQVGGVGTMDGGCPLYEKRRCCTSG